MTGITVRHARACAKDPCNCKPTFKAWAYDKRSGKKLTKTFPTQAAAKSWRVDALAALKKGVMSAPTRVTLWQAAEAWLEAAKSGQIRTRSRRPYKPSTIRSYEQGLRDHVYAELGAVRLTDIDRNTLQDLADSLLAVGLDPSTVRNALAPLRVVFRRAVSRGEVAVNPTSGLELPAPEGRRERIADPAEAGALIAALPVEDRALWATAFYAGLRAGEIQGLRWPDVDLAAGIIKVSRAYDPKARRFVEPKSRAGRRSVPVPAVLRDYLVEHRMRRGAAEGLVFGRTAEAPFTSSNVWRRARTAWKRAGLVPIGLHEARHTYASLMIGAGVNAKALSTYLGHSSIQITFDRYGHLMPGGEIEAAELLDGYLERANTQARIAQVEISQRQGP
jgi:integrase